MDPFQQIEQMRRAELKENAKWITAGGFGCFALCFLFYLWDAYEQHTFDIGMFAAGVIFVPFTLLGFFFGFCRYVGGRIGINAKYNSMHNGVQQAVWANQYQQQFPPTL